MPESERGRTAPSPIYMPNIAAWNSSHAGALPLDLPVKVVYNPSDARPNTARVLAVTSRDKDAGSENVRNVSSAFYPGDPTGGCLGAGDKARQGPGQSSAGTWLQAQQPAAQVLASPRQHRDYVRRVKNMIDAGLSDVQIVQHAALRDSNFTPADVAALRTHDLPQSAMSAAQTGREKRLGRAQESTLSAVTEQAVTEQAVTERAVMELLERGYTDQQILKHYSLDQSGVSLSYVVALRRQNGHVLPGSWLPGMGRLPPALLL